MGLGMLVLRLVVGGTIAAHGAQKLFGSFGGPGIKGFGGFLESMGFKPGRTYATVAGTAEFGGGLLLLLGWFTPFASAAIAGMMLGAIFLVHKDNGFFNQDGGIEFPLILGTAALVPAFAGPGAASFDNALGLGLHGVAWGLVAASLAGIGAMFTLASRSDEAEATAEIAEGDSERAA